MGGGIHDNCAKRGQRGGGGGVASTDAMISVTVARTKWSRPSPGPTTSTSSRENHASTMSAASSVVTCLARHTNQQHHHITSNIRVVECQ